MPVRRIREAGRPNIHWMRSRDSCGHDNRGGNSYFQSGRDNAAGREDRRAREGLWLIQVNFSGERPEETLKNQVLVGTGIFRHLVWKQRRRWGHQFLLHHQEELHRWWDFSRQRFKFQHGLHFENQYLAINSISVSRSLWLAECHLIKSSSHSLQVFEHRTGAKNPHFQICYIVSPH